MKMKRILSTLLAVTLLMGALSSLSFVEIGAEEATDTKETVPIDKYIEASYAFNSPEDKLDSMTVMSKNDKYELYVDLQSGEVGLKEISSGNILLSNPYDVAADKVSQADTKKQLLSQIVITYTDSTGKLNNLYSYTDAALNDQLLVQKIKNGVRVEYTIGREDTRKMVPKLILADSFEENILAPLKEALEKNLITEDELMVFENSWRAVDVNDMKLSIRQAHVQRYPFLDNLKVEKLDASGNVIIDQRGDTVYTYPCFYVFQEEVVNGISLLERENMIKTYTNYTFEQMDADHEITGYEAEDVRYPLFKLALEYYLEDDGLTVRLPCNGLRYDMATYTLENISVLPYMGCGSNLNAGFVYNNGESLVKTDGYTFFPDGAGALFGYEELNTTTTTTIPGKLYGEDYAYRKLFEIKNQKAIRYPVYGAVSSEVIHEYSYILDGVENAVSVSNTVKDTETVLEDIAKLKEDGATILVENIGENASVYHRGFVAMIEEADSFAELMLEHGGSKHSYNTVSNYFNPKPKDSYNLADAISVAGNTTMTVVSDRKYTGSMRIHYSMLCDESRAEAAKENDSKFSYFETSWLGMAEAYRTRLTNAGALTRLTEDDVKADIPLYIEVFGALETQQTIATIPVNMMTPLTSFEDIKTMYDELEEEGIRNINFKMTGFANGGMYATVPSSLKWEDAVGGEKGFEALVEQAGEINEEKDHNFGLYPDFDFTYVHVNTLFDDVYLQDDVVMSIDNRYATYKQYSATQQTFVSFYQLAVSPARYEKFYTKLLENYEKYGLKSMSVASLGTTLNSDFNEENPFNREDAKEYTMQAFSDIKKAGYSLMSDGGNAYILKYADHILNAELDSSRYLQAMASVPFVGAVLHGSKQFTGTPLNEEGDVRYAMLRAIESGAALQFILSYQNTNELKKDSYLSQYYSIQYKIWKDDVVDYYTELNNLLKDVQTDLIVGHEFLVGERVLDADELEAIVAQKLEEASRLEDVAQKEKLTAELIAIAEAWTLAYNADSRMQALLADLTLAKEELAAIGEIDKVFDFSLEIPAVLEAMKALDEFYEANKEMADAEEKSKEYLDEEAVYVQALADANEALNLKLKGLRDCTETFVKLEAKVKALYESRDSIMEALDASVELVTNTSLYDDNQENRDVILDQIAEGKKVVESYFEVIDAVFAEEDFAYMASVATDALEAIDASFYDAFEEKGAYAEYKEAYFEAFEDEFSPMFFDEEDIKEMVASEDENASVEEENEEQEDSFYHVDNRKIVAVTYGETDENGNDVPTKTFILNYNTFAVRVNYHGIGYMIPSGGYIVIDVPQND